MPDAVKDAVADPSPADPTKPDAKGSQDAADSGESNVPWNKDPRFREFLANKKEFDEYKKLGKPDELRTAHEKAKVLDDLLKEAEKDQAPPPKKDATREAQIREAQQALLEVFPWLADVPQQMQRLNVLVNSVEGAARDATRDLLEEHGLSTEKGNVARWEERLADVILHDPKLANRFYRDPEGTAKAAFKSLTKEVEEGLRLKQEAEKQKKGEPLSHLPKTHPAGGGSGSGAEVKGPPKSIAEATRIAIARLSAEA